MEGGRGKEYRRKEEGREMEMYGPHYYLVYEYSNVIKDKVLILH